MYHTTVLLHEGVEALEVRPGGVYVDATFGGGGHSRLILEKVGASGKLIAFDQDPDAVANAPKDDRFQLCQANFRFLRNFLNATGYTQVDGVLADLGVSGYQFDEASRGFSFRFDAALDMRMNPAQAFSAQRLIAEYEEVDLRRVFKHYGETSFANALARRIVAKRVEKPVVTTGDLVQIIDSLVPAHKRNAELAKIFQALRIEVNDEMGALRDFLQSAIEVLKPGGHLVVISYHSLEDRLVKHVMRSGNADDTVEKDVFGNIIRPMDPLGKAITPSDEEIERNPRARSAKMRIGVKRINGRAGAQKS